MQHTNDPGDFTNKLGPFENDLGPFTNKSECFENDYSPFNNNPAIVRTKQSKQAARCQKPAALTTKENKTGDPYSNAPIPHSAGIIASNRTYSQQTTIHKQHKKLV